jgi:transposase
MKGKSGYSNDYGEGTGERRAVGGGGALDSGAAGEAEGGTATGVGSEGVERHIVCAEDRHSVGISACGDGLRMRDDLLATPARVAGGGGVGAPAPGVAGAVERGGTAGLVASQRGLRFGARGKRGAQTGPSPVNRGKPGTKQHLAVDRQGLPLAAILGPANAHDSLSLAAVLDAIPPVRQRRGAPRRRPAKLHADKGYDFPRCRREVRRRHIIPRIARRGIESSRHLGRHRWVVERTIAWLHRNRRLRVRYERRDDIHQAFLTLACSLICFHHLQRFC